MRHDQRYVVGFTLDHQRHRTHVARASTSWSARDTVDHHTVDRHTVDRHTVDRHSAAEFDHADAE